MPARQLVIMPKFDLAEFLDNIAEHECTHAFIAPPVAVALAKHPLVDSYDLSSLRGIMSGAAPLDEDLGQAVTTRLDCQVVQGYGMSELSPVSHVTPFDGGRETLGSAAPLSSCGWTVPNAVSKIVDPETGDEIDPPASRAQRHRRAVVQGPNVMAGYLGNDEATAETIDDDGFLHTGDIARVDSERLRLHRRPTQGTDQVQGLSGAARRTRGAAAHPPADRRCRRHRRARCRLG